MTQTQLEATVLLALSAVLLLASTVFYWPMRRVETHIMRWAGVREWSEDTERIVRKCGMVVSLLGVALALSGFFYFNRTLPPIITRTDVAQLQFNSRENRT